MKKLKIVAIFMLMAITMTACSRREIHTIEANQTAIMIPLKDNLESQASFESEELLSKGLVSAKQVSITYTREKVGPMDRQWVANNMLIIVDRTPVTREWSSESDVGTSSKNQSIAAESKESIGFSAGMNCSAQIYSEDDAVKFLYSYNNQSLSDIMDTEIRARVESDFVEICGKYTIDEILEKKDVIMNYVRDDVISYFADRGITITVLGMKDGLDYDDEEVQESMNASLIADRNAKAQAIENQMKIDKAKSEAEAILIAAQAEADANKLISDSLTEMLLEQQRNERWDGHEVPNFVNTTPILSMDLEGAK